MGPPPPSASYLWKFDDCDTDDDDDDDDSQCDPTANFTCSKYTEGSDATPMFPVSHATVTRPCTTTGMFRTTRGYNKTTETHAALAKEDDGSSRSGPTNKQSTDPTDQPSIVAFNSIDTIDDDSNNTDLHNDSIDDDGDNNNNNNKTANVTLTTPGKKRKGKKKRKTKLSSPNTTLLEDGVLATTSSRHCSRTTRHVTFSSVTITTFQRCFGLDVVPTQGGWPLGMEYYDHGRPNNNYDEDTDTTNPLNDGNQNHDNYSVDEYEIEKQERLLQRYQKLAIPQIPADSPNRHNKTLKDRKKKMATQSIIIDQKNNGSSRIVQALSSKQLVLETRQWDYKHRQKNPLFGILHESDRMNLLLSIAKITTSNGSSTTGSSPISNVWVETATSSTAIPNHHHPSNAGRHTSHSHSNNHPNDSRKSTTAIGSDHHGYTTNYVNSIRNALEQIRLDRTTGIGCQCRKLQVPIWSSSSPSATTKKNNGHHPKRMKLQKLKDELMKRQLWSDDDDNHQLTREDMEQLLHDAVEQEPCCLYTDTCFCARNGIGCQADVCTCWHRRHQTGTTTKSPSQSSSSTSTTAVEIQERCGNTVGGMYVVDDHHIDTVRTDFLQRLTVCPFLLPSTES